MSDIHYKESNLDSFYFQLKQFSKQRLDLALELIRFCFVVLEASVVVLQTWCSLGILQHACFLNIETVTGFDRERYLEQGSFLRQLLLPQSLLSQECSFGDSKNSPHRVLSRIPSLLSRAKVAVKQSSANVAVRVNMLS